ncbi:MAG: hypothetical protein ABIO70_02965 [Pseudomonadota bacterium]
MRFITEIVRHLAERGQLDFALLLRLHRERLMDTHMFQDLIENVDIPRCDPVEGARIVADIYAHVHGRAGCSAPDPSGLITTIVEGLSGADGYPGGALLPLLAEELIDPWRLAELVSRSQEGEASAWLDRLAVALRGWPYELPFALDHVSSRVRQLLALALEQGRPALLQAVADLEHGWQWGDYFSALPAVEKEPVPWPLPDDLARAASGAAGAVQHALPMAASLGLALGAGTDGPPSLEPEAWPEAEEEEQQPVRTTGRSSGRGGQHGQARQKARRRLGARAAGRQQRRELRELIARVQAECAPLVVVARRMNPAADAQGAPTVLRRLDLRVFAAEIDALVREGVYDDPQVRALIDYEIPWSAFPALAPMTACTGLRALPEELRAGIEGSPEIAWLRVFCAARTRFELAWQLALGQAAADA